MNANTQWHWGTGDHDADVSGDEEEPLMLEGNNNLKELTYKEEAPPAAAASTGSGDGQVGPNALALYDGPGGQSATSSTSVVAFNADKAKANASKRQIIGNRAVRLSAALVPRATEDCLSNDKLQPVSSGRGFALLEKMGWKKGQGLGRQASGVVEPVTTSVKTDMGGLAAREERSKIANAVPLSDEGP
eukprot:6193234-Pleurochrysis_carterae.AAC.1